MVSSRIESLVTLPEIGRPTVSPAGDSVACYYSGTGENEVLVVDTQTGDREQWSDGGTPNHMQWPLFWDSDGEQIYLHVDEAGDEGNDIYALDSDGAVTPVLETTGQTNVHDVVGDTLLVTSTHEGQMNLYTYDTGTETLRKRTDHSSAVWEATLSPDGTQVAYATNETDDSHNQDVYVSILESDTSGAGQSDRATSGKFDIGERGSETIPVDWSPDGTHLLVEDDGTGIAQSGLFHLDSATVDWYGEEAVVESPAFVLPDGTGFIAERTQNATVTPVYYDINSGESRVLDLTHGVADFGWRSRRIVDDQRILLTYTRPTRRQELVVYNLATDDSRTIFDRDYGEFSRSAFADATYFWVESDGVPDTRQAAVEHEPSEPLEIGALLYDSGNRPSPLVVKPHGGPRRMDKRQFNRRVQFLCALGYSVLQVNFRGSSGRGREFAQTLVGDFGGAEQGDIATVTEHVLQTRDWIDADRVGIYGGSYGGYSTYWQLVQYPSLYDAGAAVVGMTDLLDAYEQAPPNFQTEYFERYLGSPAANESLYRERSPVTHAENLAAPLLIVHGTNDPRVPISQARRLRDRLGECGFVEGVEGAFEYHELTERGHGTVDTDQRRHTAQLFADFLNRRL